ncbi:hypothetical protein H0H81_003698 [Sphagnurus paluster]|uniref:HAT C-terminal dimerisation domain-containing protein n=1 Tax=Sphagnurus paluster TaxID=117069 RepID=A0A9P7FSG5_9AGAR|nr:hypothetical protein H0H81_003698 [Sphagnurus paluster]
MAQDQCIMCFPHMINICADHMTEKASDIPYSDDLDNYRGEVVTSGGRRDRINHFKDTIKFGNKKKWFKDGDKVVFLELHLALDCFISITWELKHLKMTPAEWSHLEDIVFVLGLPHAIQITLKTEKMPTLSSVILQFKLFMTSLEELGKATPSLKEITDVGILCATKYYLHMDNSRTYTVAMFINPTTRFSCIEKHWGSVYIRTTKAMLIKIMNDYRACYATLFQASALAKPASVHNDQMYHVAKRLNLASMLGLDTPVLQVETLTTVEEEFDTYTCALSLRGTDMIKFWDVTEHQKMFLTIYRIALDYIPVQASAIPCEHIFSSAKESMVVDTREAVDGVEDVDGLNGLMGTDPNLGKEAFNRALAAICID